MTNTKIACLLGVSLIGNIYQYFLLEEIKHETKMLIYSYHDFQDYKNFIAKKEMTKRFKEYRDSKIR